MTIHPRVRRTQEARRPASALTALSQPDRPIFLPSSPSSSGPPNVHGHISISHHPRPAGLSFPPFAPSTRLFLFLCASSLSPCSHRFLFLSQPLPFNIPVHNSTRHPTTTSRFTACRTVHVAQAQLPHHQAPSHHLTSTFRNASIYLIGLHSIAQPSPLPLTRLFHTPSSTTVTLSRRASSLASSWT